MRIVTESIDIPRGDRVMRTCVARPVAAGRWPALAFYSDIFQITPSTRRMVERFAGYGFAVVAPDIYWRYEAPGEAWAFDDAGRDRGNLHARTMRVRDFDDDITALLDAMAGWPFVKPDAMGAVGFCTGGHIAVRAAFSPRVRATVCFYPTGLHDGELAGDPDAGSPRTTRRNPRRSAVGIRHARSAHAGRRSHAHRRTARRTREAPRPHSMKPSTRSCATRVRGTIPNKPIGRSPRR